MYRRAAIEICYCSFLNFISTLGWTGQGAFRRWSEDGGGAGHGLQGWAQDICQQRWAVTSRWPYRSSCCSPLSVSVLPDLRVSGCYGLFVPGPSPGHITMATVDEKTTLAVNLTHTRALDEARGAAVQVGLKINQIRNKFKSPAQSS